MIFAPPGLPPPLHAACGVDISKDAALAALVNSLVEASIASCLQELYHAGGIPSSPGDIQLALNPLMQPFLGTHCNLAM
jgi:hypothetical protein